MATSMMMMSGTGSTRSTGSTGSDMMTMMMKFVLSSSLLLLLLIIMNGSATSASTASVPSSFISSTYKSTNVVVSPPTFHIDDLLLLRTGVIPSSDIDDLDVTATDTDTDTGTDEQLRHVLSTSGLFAVQLSSSVGVDTHHHLLYDKTRTTALQGLCQCYDHPRFHEIGSSSSGSSNNNNNNKKHTHTMTLMDSFTKRTSLGTATVGTQTPLPLPTGDLEEVCGLEATQAMDELRDVVNQVTQATLVALDRVLLTVSGHHQHQQHRPAPSAPDTAQAQAQAPPPSTILQDKYNNKSYQSITEIVESATNLEHFHVYHRSDDRDDDDLDLHDNRTVFSGGASDNTSNNPLPSSSSSSSKSSSKAAWDWHTDAGLFLVFVPAMSCDVMNSGRSGEGDEDTSFWYQDVVEDDDGGGSSSSSSNSNSSSRPVQAQFDPSTVIVMMGQGIQEWLDLSSSPSSSSSSSSSQSQSEPVVRATVHSVQFDDDDHDDRDGSRVSSSSTHTRVRSRARAWYGTMQLVPETAIIQPQTRSTLADVRSSLSYHYGGSDGGDDAVDDDVVSIGCGSSVPFNTDENSSGDDDISTDSVSSTPRSRRRRRLQHQDPAGCNNVTNFFCWMQCLDVPQADEAQEYVNDGYSLYCLDPSVLGTTDTNLGDAVSKCEEGWIHDPACTGSWQLTQPYIPTATIDVTAETLPEEEPFCYGGTTMYMDGFQLVQGTTCVIYLFQSWVLDTGGKFAIAFIGTVIAGIGLEKIIQQRRHVMMIMKIPQTDSLTDIKRAKRRRLVASALFYGTQLTIGYMLMLVIMIYSGLLFFGTVLGLVSGHVMFNANDAIWPLKTTHDDDDEDEDDVSDSSSHEHDEDRDDDSRHRKDVATKGSCCMQSNPSKNPIEVGESPLDDGELHHGIDIEGRGAVPSATASSTNDNGLVDEKKKQILHSPSKSCCSTADTDTADASSERPTEITMDLNSNNVNDAGTLSSSASVDNGSSQTATNTSVTYHPCGCSNKNNCDPNCSTNDVAADSATAADGEASSKIEDKKSTAQSSTTQSNNRKSNSKKSKAKVQNRSHGVAEGATPCCQHSL